MAQNIAATREAQFDVAGWETDALQLRRLWLEELLLAVLVLAMAVVGLILVFRPSIWFSPALSLLAAVAGVVALFYCNVNRQILAAKYPQVGETITYRCGVQAVTWLLNRQGEKLQIVRHPANFGPFRARQVAYPETQYCVWSFRPPRCRRREGKVEVFLMLSRGMSILELGERFSNRRRLQRRLKYTLLEIVQAALLKDPDLTVLTLSGEQISSLYPYVSSNKGEVFVYISSATRRRIHDLIEPAPEG